MLLWHSCTLEHSLVVEHVSKCGVDSHSGSKRICVYWRKHCAMLDVVKYITGVAQQVRVTLLLNDKCVIATGCSIAIRVACITACPACAV